MTRLKSTVFALVLAAATCVHADEPDAMTYWSMAVEAMGDLRTEPAPIDLARGAELIGRAKALGCRNETECELIDAVAQYYHCIEERSHDMRLVHFERALSRSRRVHPDDPYLAYWHERASRAAFARAVDRAEAAYFRLAQP